MNVITDVPIFVMLFVAGMLTGWVIGPQSVRLGRHHRTAFERQQRMGVLRDQLNAASKQSPSK